LDSHLNIFNSYSQGGFDNSKEIRVLEDNVTRALIICLKEIDSFAIIFLEDILSLKINKKPQFDLQHLNGINKSIVKNCPKKYLLGISPTGNNPYEKHISINNLEHEEKKEEQLILKHGSRADAWIWEVNNFIVLIENKIYGELYKEQIDRHITDKKGLDTKDLEENHKKFVKWKQIFNIVVEFIKRNKNEEKIYLLIQFKEYLEMTNAVLDPFISKNNSESRTIYLRNLVKQIERKISEDADLKQYYEHLKIDGKYMSYVGIQLGKGNAHYNVSFNPDSIGINLTLWSAETDENGKSQILNYIDQTISKCKDFGNKKAKITKDQNLLIRYDISCIGYRKYMKYQSLKSFTTFVFSINFYEFVMNFNSYQNKKKIFEEFFNVYAETRKLGLSKQIDIGYCLSIPDESENEKIRNNEKYKGIDIRLLNEEILLNLDDIVSNFVDFIKDTIKIAKIFGLEKKLNTLKEKNN